MEMRSSVHICIDIPFATLHTASIIRTRGGCNIIPVCSVNACPHRKNFKGEILGERGGEEIGPPWPILMPGNI
jgi:hypothetical protein